MNKLFLTKKIFSIHLKKNLLKNKSINFAFVDFVPKSNMPTVKSGFAKFMSKVKKFLLKRIVLFRVLFYSSLVLIVFTTLRYSNNMNFAKNITPVFFLKNRSDLTSFYNVAGIIKPGSINFIKGSDEFNFLLTDYEHELKIYYKGVIPQNFLEGNTAIAHGNITDTARPFIFMCTKIETDHSYNSDKWMNRKIEKGATKSTGVLDKSMMKKKDEGDKYTNMK